MYHTRVCEQLIERTAASFPCIVVYGPRQAGKSTTIHHLFKDFCPMITLDDRSDRDLALTDPHRFLEAYGWPLVIDEIQKAPQLLDEIKKQIDAQRLKWRDEGKPQKLMYILGFPLNRGLRTHSLDVAESLRWHRSPCAKRWDFLRVPSPPTSPPCLKRNGRFPSLPEHARHLQADLPWRDARHRDGNLTKRHLLHILCGYLHRAGCPDLAQRLQ